MTESAWRKELRKHLLEKHQVKDNPKAEIAFEIAIELVCEREAYMDVEEAFEMLVRLIK